MTFAGFHEEHDDLFDSGPLDTSQSEYERVERRTPTTVESTLALCTLSSMDAITPRSVRRYQPIADEEDITPAPRSYRPRQVHVPANVATRTAQPARYRDDNGEGAYAMQNHRYDYGAGATRNTNDDEQIAPSVRTSTSQKAQNGKPQKRGKHPLFYVGATALGFLLVWEGLTAVPAWTTTTFADPGTYGPSHGETLQITLGNGDSATSPSTLIATNINGQIDLIQLFPGDPKKNITFTGPNLNTLNFPDPAKAEVALSSPEAGKVIVTIWSDEWDKPLHRYGVEFTLLTDGKGGFRQDGPLTIIQ